MRIVVLFLLLSGIFLADRCEASQFCGEDNAYYSNGVTGNCFATAAEAEKYLYTSIKTGATPAFQDIDASRFEPKYVDITSSDHRIIYQYKPIAPPYDLTGPRWMGGVCGNGVGPFPTEQQALDATLQLAGRPLSQYAIIDQRGPDGRARSTGVHQYSPIDSRRQETEVFLGSKSYSTGGIECDTQFTIIGLQYYACPDTYNAVSGPFSQGCSNGVDGKIYQTSGAIQSGQTCERGNPCHPQTGIKTQDEVDFAWEGMTFKRTFSSSSETPANPGLGQGWLPSWDYSIARNIDGLWMVRVDDKIERYRNDPATGISYSIDSPGSRLVLTSETRVDLADGRSITFDMSSGTTSSHVLSIYDRKTNTTYQFEYCAGSDATCTAGNLKDIKSSRGRQVDFIYGEIRNTAGAVIGNRLLGIGDDSTALVSYGYDSAGRLQTATYPGTPATTRTYGYNEAGRVCVNSNGSALTPCYVMPVKPLLTSITDENSVQYATFKYDNYGRVVSSEHIGGVDKVAMTYSSDLVSTVTDANGGVATYTSQISKSFYKLASLSIGGKTSSSTYDANGYQDLATDKSGVVTDYDYDSLGHLIKITRAKGTTQQQVETTIWDPVTNLPAQVDRVGQRSNWTYNGRGKMLTVTATDLTVSPNTSRTTSYNYCEQADVDQGSCPILGELTSVDGPRLDVSDITRYSYYPSDDVGCTAVPIICTHHKGDLWKTTNAAGQTTENLAYDTAGRVASIKNANGVVTDFEYSTRGWLAARKVRGLDNSVETDDAITRFNYDNIGHVSQVSQPDGVIVQLTYDLAHRMTDITDAFGNKIHFTLDNAGITSIEVSLFRSGVLKRTLSRIYNTLGQIQTLKDANLAATGMTYDANGALNTSTDALGRVTDGDVDALGRLSQIIANLNNKATDQATTKFQYDTRNNLTAVIDPKGLTTGYTYDGLDNLRQLSSPDSGVTSYGYDAAGNRVSKLDARGITTTYNYDALSRLTGQLGPTVAQNAYFDYDLPTSDCLGGETFDVHRLAQIRDESGSTRYCYDRLGNLVRKVQGVSGGTTLTTGDTYNVAGRVSAITYPSGATVTYQRDSDGRITRINAVPVVGASQVTLVSSVSYLPFGPIAALTFGNGRVLTKAYDKNYGVDIVSDSVTGGLSEDLTLNSVGAVTGLAERVSASSSVGRTFVYDGLDRLTTQKNGNTTVEGFKYDTTGNRTSKTVGNTTTTYGYQSTNHRLSAVGSLARTYDASGSTALIGSGASAPGFVFDDGGRLRDYKVGTVVKASYRYNGNGERVLRIDSANGANSEQFVYDEAEHLLGEYTLTGARVKEYVWLEDTLVAVLSDHDGSNYQFVETDQLGTPRAVIHPVKNIIIWRWDLNNTAFGEHLPNADPDANALSYTLNVRYAGQYYDGISGLEYNYFRDYDAATGRYLESDPTGLLGGTSTYGYSMERPLDFFDETGLGSAPSRGLSAASRSAGSRAAYRAFMRNNTGPRPDFSELYSERSSQSLEAASEMNNWRPPDYICVDVWCHPQQKNPHECSIGEDVWSHKDFYKPYPTVGEVNAMGNCICKRGINAADYEYEAPSANGYDAAEVYAKQRELARAMKEAQMRELRD